MRVQKGFVFCIPEQENTVWDIDEIWKKDEFFSLTFKPKKRQKYKRTFYSDPSNIFLF